MSRSSVLASLRWWADLLDSRFRIPGTSIRFGIDPILSLLPGLGDLASPAYTLALLVFGIRLRLPKVIVVRMVANALIDAAIGAIPVAGNVGDIFWRANLANLALLERHARPGVAPTPGDYAFVWSIALVFGILLAVPVFVAIWIAMTMWRLI
jgi:Domain of unknown function (DUF4112)